VRNVSGIMPYSSVSSRGIFLTNDHLKAWQYMESRHQAAGHNRTEIYLIVPSKAR
jgi:hypothetical protein